MNNADLLVGLEERYELSDHDIRLHKVGAIKATLICNICKESVIVNLMSEPLMGWSVEPSLERLDEPCAGPGTGNIIITTNPCSWCGKTSKVVVDAVQHAKWVQGAYVQKAFPAMNADEREQLISGTHPACWEEMFGGGDE